MAAPHLNPLLRLGGDLRGTLPNPSLIGIGIPQNTQSGDYTVDEEDNGKHIFHASGAGSGHTYTIPANGTAPLKIGFAFTVVNLDSNALAIAIDTDDLTWCPSGQTGARELAEAGVATFLKVTATAWVCFGVGLS